MDPAVAALDFSKAGAIIASMVESYLAAGAPPSLDAKGAPHDDDVQDQRSTCVPHVRSYGPVRLPARPTPEAPLQA